MKKIYLLLMAVAGTAPAMAQNAKATAGTPTTTATIPAPAACPKDADLPKWCFDINVRGGGLVQNPTWATSNTTYANAIAENTNLGKLTLDNGSTFGVDAQIGYFFGQSNHWGLGAGFMYLSQRANAKLDNYHVEYASRDKADNIYRQIVTGYNLKEKLEITNLNIPLVLKYKARFSRRLGFTADAGMLFNVQMNNKITTDASFDYEAVYRYSNTSTGLPTTYDNSPTPMAGSFLITKNEYLSHHADGGNVQGWFNQQRAEGYNVGLGLTPTNRKSEVAYDRGSVGFIFQPALSIYLSDNVALNVGAFYIYQSFKKTPEANYQLSSNLGADYSSMINTVSATENHAFGGNIGLRFLFGKMKDTDKDGIPDKKDKCPVVFGLPQFMGCPDTDKDGIPDTEDACPTVPGLVQFKGCPDTDSDGIPDKDDACPTVAGPAKFRGCPDRDGDGIVDKDDACPDKPGLATYRGCPDTDGDGIPDNTDQCPEVAGPASNNGCPPPPPPPPAETLSISTPILFEVNKTVIARSSMPVLEAAVQKMDEDRGSMIVIEGYTDNTGSLAYNQKLSVRRALAVKKKLVEMGANPRNIKVIGYGPKNPAANNSSTDGRAQNRRAVMKLSLQ